MPSGFDRSAVGAFRERLRSAGYSLAELKRALAAAGPGMSFSPAGVRVALRRLQDDSALATLIRLFVLGVAVPVAEARDALAPVAVESVAGLGVVEVHDDAIRSLVRIVPTGGLLVASDWRHARGMLPRPEHVLGVSESSVRLANLTVRRPVDSVLDLGAGGGVQALLAARHADRVVGTDLNPRALEFARFNAALNGIENVDWRAGSYFEPVAGQTFDLIVSNPPFVISPDADMLFRDGGQPGDAVSRHIVQAVPDFLTDGGIATVIVSWALRRDDHWSAPLERWVDGNGCDAWLIHDSSADPLGHAASWNVDLDAEPDAHTAALDRWVGYLRDENIEKVGYGAIILRKRAGRTWRRADDIAERPVAPASAQITSVIEAEDWLAATGDSALLDQRLQLIPGHHVEETRRIGSRGYEVDHTTIVMDGGLPLRHEPDALCVALLSAFDGQRTVGQAIATAGAPSDERALDEVRRLVRLGVLGPR